MTLLLCISGWAYWRPGDRTCYASSFLHVCQECIFGSWVTSFDHAASWSCTAEIFSLWVPEFVNYLDYYWGENPFKLNTEYAGAIALLLGVLAVIRRPGVHRYFWAGFTIFVLSYSLGAHSFVFKLAYYIVPGVSKFRAASMITFWFSFGVVLLAGLFLKDIAEGKLSGMNEESQKKWIKGILLAICGCFVITLLFSNKGFVQGMFASALVEKNKQAVFDINFSSNLYLICGFGCFCNQHTAVTV